MNLKDIQALAVEMDTLLRLKTYSLGIKFYEKVSDVPDIFQRMTGRKSVCMLMGYARFIEVPVVLTPETYAHCWASDVALGWGTLPADLGKQAAGYVAATPESVDKAYADFISLHGKYQAIAVAPLRMMPVEPDIIQVWGSPLQMMQMEYASTWNGWDKIVLESNGHGASCYEVLVLPFVNRASRFAIADNGDRRHGMARDEDMIMGFPIEQLEGYLVGLRAQQADMNALPIMYDFDAIPFPVSKQTLSRRFPKYT